MKLSMLPGSISKSLADAIDSDGLLGCISSGSGESLRGGLGEVSSGLAIRSPPSALDKLRSPFMMVERGVREPRDGDQRDRRRREVGEESGQ